MENYIIKNDYKKNNTYNKSYNNIIENFTTSTSCSSTISDTDATNLLLYKSSGSSIYDSYYSTKTLDNGETVSNIAHFLSITDSDWSTLMTCLQEGQTNVSSDVASQYYSSDSTSFDSKRTAQKSSVSSNYIVYNNSVKDSILTLMETQNDTWKLLNSSDSDYQNKLNNYMVEKAALKAGEDYRNPYEKSVSKYKTDTNVYYDNLRLDTRNDYIKQVQDNIIEKDKVKDKMATADIMTKGREIQLRRVAFLRQQRVNNYYKISVFILGLCIIVIAIAKMVPDSNKIATGVVVGLIIIFGLYLVIGKLIRDSKRYNLDYDEVNYPKYSPKKKKKKKCNNQQ